MTFCNKKKKIKRSAMGLEEDNIYAFFCKELSKPLLR